MAAPILKVPIDDAAFKRFLDTFQKYQKELAAQPEMWKGMNDSMADAAISGAAIAAEIAHQAEATRELAAEEAKRDKAMQQAADEAEKEAKRAKKRDDDAAKRRKDAIDQVKSYTKSLYEAAVAMGKWAVVGEGMAIGATILGGFGMRDLAGWAGDSRKSAMSLGVSVGQQQRANLTLGRYISPDAALEKIANAQGTPEGMTTFAKMGINPAGKDPAQLLYEAAEKAAGFMNKYKGSPAQLTIAQQQGYGDIFSPDELRALAAAQANKNELHKTITKGNKTWEGLGISDETGQKWQEFSATIDAVGLKLKDKLADKLTVLSPSLEKVTAAFGDLIDYALTKTNLDMLAQGIDTFAKYIGSQTFKDDMSAFANGISTVAGWMRKLFGDDKSNPDLKLNPNRFTPDSWRHGGATGDWGDSGGEGDGQQTTKNGDLYQWLGRWWMKQGYTEPQARGIVANMSAENAGFDPFAWGDKNKKGKYEAYGLFQEHADRRAGYAKNFGHTMESVTDRQTAIREQLEWYNIELANRHFKGLGGKSVRDALREAPDANTAAYLNSIYGEGAAGESGDRKTEATRRGANATNAHRIAVQVHLNVQPGTSAPQVANAIAA